MRAVVSAAALADFIFWRVRQPFFDAWMRVASGMLLRGIAFSLCFL
jgi:hypothetical protein